VQDEGVTGYAILLHGVNLGKRRVPMAELKALASELGYADPRTYVNSGNLLVTSDRKPAAIAAEFEKQLADRFGFDIGVTLRTIDELRTVVKDNPYPEGDPKQVTVAFAMGTIEAAAADRIAELATDQERFTLHGSEVYIDFAGGLARSKLATKLAQVVGRPATARNIRTVATLAEMGQ
jgi:uncharacterized protein (DUF1697 family)